MGYQLTDKDKEWIEFLRNNPDKKVENSLGLVKDGTICQACCLGARQYLDNPDMPDGLILSKYEIIPAYSSHHPSGRIFNCDSASVLTGDYKRYNLRSEEGEFLHKVEINGNEYESLVDMNDSGLITWPEIADFIEQNPDIVFMIHDDVTIEPQIT